MEEILSPIKFAELILGHEIPDWQKEFIELMTTGRTVCIMHPRRMSMYHRRILHYDLVLWQKNLEYHEKAIQEHYRDMGL